MGVGGRGRWIAKWVGLIAFLWLATPRDLPAAPVPVCDVLADYAAELRGPAGRVAVESLVARLTELGVTHYYWLIWHAATDWEDLKLFLPQAAQAGITVAVYLVPPSESPPHESAYAEPFRLDYQRWGEEIARLALVHPNLTSWVIDDFCDARNTIFTPAYIRKVQAAAKKINPRLGFLPVLYFDEVTNQFVDQYREVIDGVVVAYPQDRFEVERTWAILNAAPRGVAGEFNCPWSTPSQAGDFVMASQTVKVVSAERPAEIRFREQDNFTKSAAGYHWKQLLVDDAVVWESDVTGGALATQEIAVDVTRQVAAKTHVTIAFRLFDKKGVSNFGVLWRVDDVQFHGLQLAENLAQPHTWQVTRHGPLTTSFGPLARPAQRQFHIPLVVMTAGDAGEFRSRHGDPASPERIADWLRMALHEWRAGRCEGVVTYCLDKRPNSQTFAPAQKLFHEFRKDRSGTAKSSAPAASAFDFQSIHP